MLIPSSLAVKLENCIQRSLTQEALAGQVDKAVETISNIERGHTAAGLATLDQIAQVLGLPLRHFFEEAEIAQNLNQARLDAELSLQREARALTDEELRITLELARSLNKAKDRSAVKRGG